jgi:hypothetical protein
LDTAPTATAISQRAADLESTAAALATLQNAVQATINPNTYPEPSNTPTASPTPRPQATLTATPESSHRPSPTPHPVPSSTYRPAPSAIPQAVTETNIWNFRVRNISDSEISVTVDYSYNGQHGNYINVIVRATSGGEDLWFGNTLYIGTGRGTTTFPLTCYSDGAHCAGRTSDQVRFEMRSREDNVTFFTKVFEYSKTWSGQ